MSGIMRERRVKLRGREWKKYSHNGWRRKENTIKERKGKDEGIEVDGNKKGWAEWRE